MAFDDDFALLTGNQAFPWQRTLYEHFVAGEFPKAADIPTGLGKTSVIALWLLALAKNSRLPRRLVYVVNRRTVVDQSTAEAERLRKMLATPGARHVHDALAALAAVQDQHPLTISTLRGEFADNAEWRRDPARPAVIVGTVDMVGSRLLFGGYGCGFRSKPLHAGFLGQDSLLVHDEAHLEPAFQSLISAIADEQRRCAEPRPIRVLAMSATGRTDPDFTLCAADLDDPVVKQRLHAKKSLHLHHINDRRDLAEATAAKAAGLEGKVIVFLSSVEDAEKCAQTLRRANRNGVATLTGTMRGAERDGLVADPVFARFLPRPAEDVQLREGTVFLVATSAGEVGIDLSADHLVTDLPPIDALAQRLGRVNRYGDGDAEVHVLVEPLRLSKVPADSDDDDDDGKPGKQKREFEMARHFTAELLTELPLRSDGRRDASPASLRALPNEARLRASSPCPSIRHVDSLLFDRWSYTTIPNPFPGRPPVEEWLHGKAEWDPPRTTVAWRREVAWLTNEHLSGDSLDDFLADYPLRARETLSDRTDRVQRQLKKLASRGDNGERMVWLVRHNEGSRAVKLSSLVSDYDSKRNPTLDNATVVLTPEVGGLSDGLLNGAAEFVGERNYYDIATRPGERVVHEADEVMDPPDGMRLVRAVKLSTGEEEEALWWRLYAVSLRADDEGSRTSPKELLLDTHLRRTEAWATCIAERLGLPEFQRKALARAGRVHDLGKRRRVWQRSIQRFQDPPLAKGRMQPLQLSHYRHELGSLHDADCNGLTDEERDLALHAVAAHHGRARPHFPAIESYDPELRDDTVAALVGEVPLRFDRLQRRYGRWGLAWLESILRAADVLGSEDEEVAE